MMWIKREFIRTGIRYDDGLILINHACSDFSSNAKYLKSAITALPELTARKATLDMHMNIATFLLNGIKDRQLDSFFQIEEVIARQVSIVAISFY